MERELVEGDLAVLGNARVYLRLVMERLAVVSQRGLGSLVNPGIEDLGRADALIRAVQGRICSRAGCQSARAESKKKQ